MLKRPVDSRLSNGEDDESRPLHDQVNANMDVMDIIVVAKVPCGDGLQRQKENATTTN